MNFILVHFKVDYTIPKLIDYYKDLDLFHDLMIKQIYALYDDFEIHVITNVDKPSNNKVTYHYLPDLEKSNYAKLLMFGLLDKPAMYLDNDIILLRKFAEEHLPEENDFNLYQQFDVPIPDGYPPFMYDYPHYNSGMIWIPRPNKQITEVLQKIKDKFPKHEGDWTADEYPINYFIYAFAMKMKLFPEVNAYRKSTKIPLKDCHSIHYAGIKEKFVEELRLFSPSLFSTSDNHLDAPQAAKVAIHEN